MDNQSTVIRQEFAQKAVAAGKRMDDLMQRMEQLGMQVERAQFEKDFQLLAQEFQAQQQTVDNTTQSFAKKWRTTGMISSIVGGLVAGFLTWFGLGKAGWPKSGIAKGGLTTVGTFVGMGVSGFAATTILSRQMGKSLDNTMNQVHANDAEFFQKAERILDAYTQRVNEHMNSPQGMTALKKSQPQLAGALPDENSMAPGTALTQARGASVAPAKAASMGMA